MGKKKEKRVFQRSGDPQGNDTPAGAFPPKPDAYVGAYLPEPVVNYLRLLSVYLDRSMQKTIEHIVREYRMEHKDDDVLLELIDKAVSEWERRVDYGTEGKVEKSKYLEEIKEILEKKKTCQKHTERIIDNLETKMEGGDSVEED